MFKLLIFCLLFPLVILGAEPFNLTLTVGGQTVNMSFSKAEDLINAISAGAIEAQFPSYNGTQAVSAALDFRGLPISLDFPSGAGAPLTLSIPDLGISKTFSGATRDDAQNLFKDWLKSEGGSVVDQIMRKLAEVSPSDPVAGNPNSLMSQMVGNDFMNASSAPVSDEVGASSENLFGVGVILGNYTASGLDSRKLSVPFSYIVKFDGDPKRQLGFHLPITYVEVEKAQSFNASFGVSYRQPLYKTWAITFAPSTGLVGSIDLGSVGHIVGGSLISTVDFKFWSGNYGTLQLANMYGHYETMAFEYKGVRSNPGIANDVVRNGVVYSINHPFLFSWKSATEIFLLDTRYFGTPLYLEKYNETGFSLGSDKRAKGVSSLLRVGATYLFSNKMHGFTANLGYLF